MANLVIVESPAKASTIKGYLGSNYKVVASNGHVRDLPKSTLGVDIDGDNFTPHYINIRGKGDLIKSLRKDAKNATKVFLATDPDREGEAISWHLAVMLGLDEAKAKRVTFNEITKTAVKQGVKNPREIDMELVNSQQARRLLDRIVGYKLSPFLWKTLSKSNLSAGRVQSVATRIICEREAEINAFVPDEYWSIEAMLEGESSEAFKAKFYGNADGKTELKSEEDTNAVLNAIKGNPYIVKSIKKAVRARNPQPPFITSTLQQEASRKLGFQLTRIMKIAQSLYEGVNIGAENGGVVGLITYMRTDSMRISDDAYNAAKTYIGERFGEEYLPKSRRMFKIDQNAQDAHEAIRPTNVMLSPDKLKSKLTNEQYKLYKLIWERFIASQMASAAIDTVSVEIENSGYIFRTNGNTVKFQGYLKIYNEADDTGENALPELKENEKLTEKSIKPEQHFTEPPARYTEGTLVKFFKENGIGRPSTYSTIIANIISRGYVRREGKSLCPTPLGETTTKLMIENFPDIVDCKFTAAMEDRLDNIANGSETMNGVLASFYKGFEKELCAAGEKVKGAEYELPPELTDIICDKCGATMIVKNGKFGRFAACPNYPKCKNTRPIDNEGHLIEKKPREATETDMICEKCGAPMVMRQGRYGQFYACSAYPKCKNTKQITKDIGVKCPKCSGKIVSRSIKGKQRFFGCENYPACDFSSWDTPIKEKCPKCGSMLLKKKGKETIVCYNKDCDYQREDKQQ